MRRVLALCVVVLVSVGCSTMTPARYAVSVDNNLALKKYEGSRVKLVSMVSPASFDPNCRLMGPIQGSDGMTVPQFVQKAFNDELKFANLYAEDGVTLDGNLTKIAFSSTSGLTNGWWELDLTLKSSKGKSMDVASLYEFKSGFDAITACNQTAQALGPAVQDLIKKTVTDPQFSALLR